MTALTPRGVRRAVLIAAAVYVAVVEGTIPAAERNYWAHNYLEKALTRSTEASDEPDKKEGL